MTALFVRSDVAGFRDARRPGAQVSETFCEWGAQLGLALGAAALLVSWLLISISPWPRQGAPAWLIAAPLLMIAVVERLLPVETLKTSGQRFVAAGLLIFLVLLVATGGVIQLMGNVELIRSGALDAARSEQRRVAVIIRDSGASSLSSDGWWQNPEYQVLSGVPPASMRPHDRSPLYVLQRYELVFKMPGSSPESIDEKWLAARQECGEILYASAWNLVCRRR
jgi:hypothetical protein